MIPESKGARISYIVVAVLSVLILGFCIFVWVWAGTVEDGWISAYAAAIIVSVVGVPVALTPLGWSLGLFIARKLAKKKALQGQGHEHLV